MPKVPVTNLYQGISKTQPPHRRNTGYVEESKNTSLDITRGTIKRNGLQFKAALPRTLPALYRIISIRDVRVVIDGTNQTVWAFKENGASIAVIDNSGSANPFGYLFDIGVLELDWVVALDSILIINKAVDVVATDMTDYDIELEVNTFSELPKSKENNVDPITNAYYRVLLRENSDPAGYYQYVVNEVDPETNATFTGYKRVPAPKDKEAVWDLSTMPHQFIYDEANNSITFDTIQFENRLSGNYNSNLSMPLVGGGIEAIDYFQGRLVLLTADSVNMSANNNIKRLYVNDIDNIVTQDRISRDILESGIGVPQSTVSIAGSLVILCDSGILVFDAGNGTEMLTTTNGMLRRIADAKVQNLKYYSNGNRVAFADTNNQIRLIGITDGMIGPQVIGALNDYDPKTLEGKTITQIFTDEDQIYVVCTDGSVLVHTSTFYNNAYVQLAWSEITSNVRTPKYIDQWDSKIRIISLSTSGTYVSDEYEYLTTFRRNTVSSIVTQANVRLDALQVVTGTYDPHTDRTEFTHSYDNASSTHSMVVYIQSPSATNSEPKIEYYRPSGTFGKTFYVNGKITGQVIIGFTFDFTTTFTNLWMGANEIKLIGSRFSVIYQDTSDFILSIGRKRGKKRKVRFQSSQFNNIKINDYMPSSGVFTTMLIGDQRYIDITISSTSAAPVTINAIEYTVNGKGR